MGAIGVLDLQGGVDEHLDHLSRIGVVGRAVKSPEAIADLSGLILPGGESTCLSRLLRLFALDTAIRRAHAQGLQLWGTCAGAILLARENVGDSACLGLMDISVQRNAFGSQLDSFHCTVHVPAVAPEPVPLTFIRAPKIVAVGPSVRVLFTQGDYIAAAEDDQCLVTVFHPELTPTVAFHRYFARRCGLVLERDTSAVQVSQDSQWSPHSWTRLRQITPV